jgi:hypothetical protein
MSSLTSDDYIAFLKLRITRDVLDRAKVSRVTRDEAESKYGIRLDCAGGILFPYYLPPERHNASFARRLPCAARLPSAGQLWNGRTEVCLRCR